MITEIRQRTLSGELMKGTWCNLGNSMTVEMAARAGFDWLSIDLEHGIGDYDTCIYQLQAAGGAPAAPLVRVAWNDPVRVKRILDLGPSGIIFPWVNDADQARQAVAAMRYPPQGIRGTVGLSRANDYSWDFPGYFARANDVLLTVVQIETATGLENCREIAAVDGVDVLFAGPLDLSVSLGIPGQFDHPKLRAALKTIASAAREHHKVAGTVLGNDDMLEQFISDGFTFMALGSDWRMVANGLKEMFSAFDKYQTT